MKESDIPNKRIAVNFLRLSPEMSSLKQTVSQLSFVSTPDDMNVSYISKNIVPRYMYYEYKISYFKIHVQKKNVHGIFKGHCCVLPDNYFQKHRTLSRQGLRIRTRSSRERLKRRIKGACMYIENKKYRKYVLTISFTIIIQY